MSELNRCAMPCISLVGHEVESPHLSVARVGVLPFVFVGIVSLHNGTSSWVGLIVIVEETWEVQC